MIRRRVSIEGRPHNLSLLKTRSRYKKLITIMLLNILGYIHHMIVILGRELTDLVPSALTNNSKSSTFLVQ